MKGAVEEVAMLVYPEEDAFTAPVGSTNSRGSYSMIGRFVL